MRGELGLRREASEPGLDLDVLATRAELLKERDDGGSFPASNWRRQLAAFENWDPLRGVDVDRPSSFLRLANLDADASRGVGFLVGLPAARPPR